jgi:hypothetical protein
VKRLGLFQFLVRPALSEGSIGSAVTPISIHTVDWDPKTGQAAFPEQQVLARIRAILAARSGKPITALLAEQEQRGHILPPGQPSQPEQPDNHPAETQHTEPNQQQRGRTRRHRERLP